MSTVLCAICGEQIPSDSNNVIVTDDGMVHPVCYSKENQ